MEPLNPPNGKFGLRDVMHAETAPASKGQGRQPGCAGSDFTDPGGLTFLVVFPAILLGAPCSASADSRPAPPGSAVLSAPFSGKWTLVDTQRGGEKKWLRATEMTVTPTELRFWLFKQKAFTLTYRVLPGPDPQHIDFIAEKPYKAVYQLRGDILKICWDEKGGARPTEVKSKPGTRWIMLTLKRAK